MILIISDNNDLSTWQVVDWIKYHYKTPVEVITDKDEIILSSIFEDGEFEFSSNGKIINSKNIQSHWYRRGALRSNNHELELKGLDAPYTAIFSDYYKRETNRILQYINWKLEQKRSISSTQKSTVNKLIVLDIAKKIGLNTPPSLLTGSKQELINFIDKHGNIITKPAGESIFFGNREMTFIGYTVDVDKDYLNILPTKFAPSFFQKKIDKVFEIRTFYLHGDFFSMAIFSQQNEKTLTDFRRYDNKKPNRRVRINLPKDLEDKIVRLMEACKLNSGSIDIIYDINKCFYFLEVNPIGQFGMVSFPCNYYLENQIAKYLVSNEE